MFEWFTKSGQMDISHFEFLIIDASAQSETNMQSQAELETLKSDIATFIRCCLEVIHKQDQTEQHIRAAIVYLNSALNPRSIQELNQHRLYFNSNQEDIQMVANTAKLFLHLEQNAQFQIQGSQLFALLFGIQPEFLLPELELIISELDNASFELSMAYVTLLGDILNLKNIAEIFGFSTTTEAASIVFKLAMKIAEIACAQIDVNIELRERAISTISRATDLCKKYPSICDSLHEVYEVLIHPDNLHFMLQIESYNFNLIVHDFMANIIKGFYSTRFAEQYTRSIVMIVFDRLKYFTENWNPEIVIVILTFWREIIQYEFRNALKRIQDGEDCYEKFKGDGSTTIYALYEDDLIPILIQMLVLIDPNDTEVEDISLNQPSFIATIILAGLNQLSPHKATSQLIAKYNELREKAEAEQDWRYTHAAILCIYAISALIENPDDFNIEAYCDTATRRENAKFILNNFQYTITCAKTDNQRIRETSLYVISYILTKNKDLLRMFDDYGMVINGILTCFSMTDNGDLDENTHPMIIFRALSVISGICKSFAPSTYKSPLYTGEGGMFEPIFQRILNILSLPQCLGDTNMATRLISLGHNAISSLIQQCVRNEEYFVELTKFLMQMIGDVANSEQIPDQAKIQKFAGICRNITSVVTRFADHSNVHIMETYSMVIDGLFDMLSWKQGIIAEEALLTMAAILIRTESDSQLFHTTVPKVINCIHEMLELRDFNAIKSATVLITQLYKKCAPMLDDFTLNMITHLYDLIYDSTIVEYAVPPLIKALSDVLIYIATFPNSGQSELYRSLLQNNDFCDKFRQMIMNYRDNPVQLNDKIAIEHATNVYEAICTGFHAYACVWFSNDVAEKMTEKSALTELSKVSTVITKLQPVEGHLGKQVYAAALEMFVAFAGKTTRVNNVVLCKGVNFKLIKKAMMFNSLRERAKQVKKILYNT